MNLPHLSIRPFGESAILIEWPKLLNADTLLDIQRTATLLKNKMGGSLLDVVSAYNSLTLYVNRKMSGLDDALAEVERISSTRHEIKLTNGNDFWLIPVCYDEVFGLDIRSLASAKSIEVEELITLHSQCDYRVHFIGFLPGFLYLGGLSDKLHMPRRSSPRMKVAKGSVAIGASQTGIYPIESPGGWHIIGNCPLDLFDPHANPPCFVKPGDRLQFRPIAKEEHEEISQSLRDGNFKLDEWMLA